jgi:hypothetical protein
MLTVLGGLAEFERELIRARTGEGRKRAQARGVKFGRPPKLNAHQRKEAIARMRNGETQADIARTYGVDGYLRRLCNRRFSPSAACRRLGAKLNIEPYAAPNADGQCKCQIQNRGLTASKYQAKNRF